MIHTNVIAEAKRYLANAKDILTDKAQKEDGYYQDSKYVKMAGHTAYVGVLVALDGFLETKKRGRKSVEYYQQELAKTDKKMLSVFMSTYDILHLSMSYDGNPNAKVAKAGLEDAERIIDWVAIRLEA
jgi:Domain of unknown function (DUF5618)